MGQRFMDILTAVLEALQLRAIARNACVSTTVTRSVSSVDTR